MQNKMVGMAVVPVVVDQIADILHPCRGVEQASIRGG